MTFTASRKRHQWKGTRVAVVGLARSGVAACLFLRKRGAAVVATDRRAESELGPSIAELRALGIEFSLGAHSDLARFDAIILSPGVDPAQDSIQAARAQGVLILPELELGASEARGRVVCVTGTKGKSTTTMGLFAMLRDGGLDARAVGNVGAPISAHVDGSDEGTIFVAEASSFQLETTRDFHPDCAVFLNLFPDHLDRHPSFEAYAEAKARIFVNQTEDDLAIINADDPAVTALAARTKARIIPFRPRTPMSEDRASPGSGFDAGRAILRNDPPAILFDDDDVHIPGSAVRTNLLAAATVARLFGVEALSIRETVRAFRGIPHTFEKLGELNGVAYFNDSKATTLESVQSALLSFDTPVILIMGGRLKAGSFAALRDVVAGRVRSIQAIGESRGLIRESLQDVVEIHECDTLEEAVRSAHAAAKPGDTILLSPGCSSFDMFRDYADRGDAFKRAYRSLSLEGAA
jgi:UDP-N-acetylmuramoylalanine--D-glutamate ligase